VWRAAAESGDAEGAVSALSDDVELVSPLTEQFRFRGRAEVGPLLEVAFSVIADIEVHTHVDGGDTHAMFYRARIGDQPLEEAQLLRLDADGRIREVTLFVRSLPALTALLAALGPELARRQGRRGLAALLAASTSPLHALSRFGERRIVPLAAPER